MSAEEFRNFWETGARLLCNRKQQDLTYMLPRNGNAATSIHLKLYDPDFWWRTRLTDCQDHTIIGCIPNFNGCHKMCYHPSHQLYHHFCWDIWTKEDIQGPSKLYNHNPKPSMTKKLTQTLTMLRKGCLLFDTSWSVIYLNNIELPSTCIHFWTWVEAHRHLQVVPQMLWSRNELIINN